MVNLILIDTNIYRQLGIGFYNKPDFKNLHNYCYASGSEIRIPEVVYQEFISYYNLDVIEKSFREIEQAISKLTDIPNLSKLTNLIPNSDSVEKAKKFVIKQFKNNSIVLDNILIPINIITDFLIKNKQEIKKDNTRDFLIWYTAIREALIHSEDQIILISNDKIFTENIYFKNFLKQYEIHNNIIVYSSIAEVLNKFGEQYDFLTSDKILEKIPKSKIEREINKDINSFPSYISSLYYNIKRKFIVESFKIEDIIVDNFYSFKDIDTNKIKFLSNIKVKVSIIFESEKAEFIENHLSNIPKLRRELETFDEYFRPIFNHDILFTFEGELDVKKKLIKKMKYLDFMIDYYFDIYKN